MTAHGRTPRLALACLAVLIAAGSIVSAWAYAEAAPGAVGHDYFGYMAGVRAWGATGSPYDAGMVALQQAQWPAGTPFLHPPIALPLMAPFTDLPPLAWWLIPVGTVAFCMWQWRPPVWSWPILALGLAFSGSRSVVVTGNSGIWVVALLAAGLEWHWPAALILVKPTLAPLAIVGASTRTWWLCVVVLALVSLPMLPLWVQWIDVIQHSPPGTGLTYNSPDLAGLTAMVVLAWSLPHWRRPASSSQSTATAVK